MKRTIPTAKAPTLTSGAATPGELRQVPVADLHVLPNLNLRVEGTDDYDAGITELAAKIEANGFYDDKPLAGYVTADGKTIVVDGHRRLAAVLRLNANSLDGDVVEHLPVVIKPELDSLADITVAMIATSEGKELTMFEKGIGVKRLMADGMTADDIARRLGVSTKTIDNYLIVAGVPAKARDLLLDGKVTSTQVLRTKGDATRLEAMVKQATAAGRTRARPSDDAQRASTPPAANIGTTETTPSPTVDSFDVSFPKGGEMAAAIRQIAQEVRARITHDTGEGDELLVNAIVTVSVALEAPPKAKRVKKAATPPAPAPEPAPPSDDAEPDPLAHALGGDDDEL